MSTTARNLLVATLALITAGSIAALQAQPVKPPITNVAGPTTSAELASIITDEVGTGALVFAGASLNNIAGATTSAQLRGVISDEVGTGAAVFAGASLDQVAGATTSAQLRSVLSDESGTGVAVFQNGEVGASATVNGKTVAGLTGNTSWTPTDASGAGLSLTVNSANYTKAGQVCILEFDVTYPSTADASIAAIGGVPAACTALSANTGTTHGAIGPLTGGSGITGAMGIANNGTNTYRFNQGNGGGSNVANSNLSLARVRASIFMVASTP